MTDRRHHRRTAILAAWIAAALATPAAAQEEVAAIARTRASFERAIAANDAAAMAAAYTPDARLFPPAADSVGGTAAIRRTFTRERDYEIAHDVVELTLHGASAYEIGRWIQIRKQDRVVLGSGWYFWEWRRQPDGRWLVHRDVWSASAPVPAGG